MTDLKKYLRNHLSILGIKRKGFDASFTFREINCNGFIKFTKTLNLNKAFQNTNISTKVIKLTDDLFVYYIFRTFNNCLEKR